MESKPDTQRKDQYTIKLKIKDYLRSHRRDENFIKQFDLGYCLGITALWLYAKWLATQPETPGKPPYYRDDINWFNHVITLILYWNKPGREDKKSIQEHEIDRFIAHIQNFQYPAYYLPIAAGELEKNLQDTKMVIKTQPEEKSEPKRIIKKELSFAGLLTLERLITVLKTLDSILPNKLILIASHNHATGLFVEKKDNKITYYYFDPNNPSGEEIIHDSYDAIYLLARNIFHTHFAATAIDQYANAKIPSPLGLRIFSLDGEIPASLFEIIKKELDEIRKTLPLATTKKDYADNYSSLIMATKIGDLESVLFFLKQDIKLINLTDSYNNTALMYAAMNGYNIIVKELLKAGARFNQPNKDGDTALTLAAQCGHIDVIREFLLSKKIESYLEDYIAAFMTAILYRQGDIVNLFLENGMGPNVQDHLNNTGLILASRLGDIDMVTKLLKARANPDKQNNFGDTALICAVLSGHINVIKKLLAAGADFNIQNNMGKNAYYYAIEKGIPEIKQILKEYMTKGVISEVDASTETENLIPN